MTLKNPFSDPQIAAHYERWYHSKGKRAAQEEKTLIKKFIASFSTAKTILEIGCGTGYFTNWFQSLDLTAVGLDCSRSMILEAIECHHLWCIQGDALALPFAEQSFDVLALITTLEFVEDPYQVLKEALRVTRQGLILGVINKHSLLGLKYLRKGGAIWSRARLFTQRELKRILKQILPKESLVKSRTTLLPGFPGDSRLPWGGFIGVAVELPPQRRS